MNARPKRNFRRALKLRRLNLVKATLWAAVVVTLLSVFALYTRPDFLVTLANQVWACF